ncbi:signal recognition particle subunit SRP68 [Trichonephila clavipes]|nr:signal recognition particle subunit SRP68 [Trichonephila clavipes]
MTTDDVEPKVDDGNSNQQSDVTVHQKTFTLEILHIIKEAQQQHGLRHGDYQRYRSYCSRKLRRIRKSLHFMQASKHRFQSKKLTEETLTDVSYTRAFGYGPCNFEVTTTPELAPRSNYHTNLEGIFYQYLAGIFFEIHSSKIYGSTDSMMSILAGKANSFAADMRFQLTAFSADCKDY